MALWRRGKKTNRLRPNVFCDVCLFSVHTPTTTIRIISYKCLVKAFGVCFQKKFLPKKTRQGGKVQLIKLRYSSISMGKYVRSWALRRPMLCVRIYIRCISCGMQCVFLLMCRFSWIFLAMSQRGFQTNGFSRWSVALVKQPMRG